MKLSLYAVVGYPDLMVYCTFLYSVHQAIGLFPQLIQEYWTILLREMWEDKVFLY